MAIKDLGCSIAEFKSYFELLFRGNMTWDNWGTVWEIDHIKTIGLFDMTDSKQVAEAFHFSNMQPLFLSEHKIKSDLDRNLVLNKGAI